MKARAAFTLTELLAVMAIALILVAGSIGVLVGIAGHIGPQNGAAELQALLNAARSYAASEHVQARLVLETKTDKWQKGTIVSMEYLPAGRTNWGQAEPVPNQPPMGLGRNIFALSLSPGDLGSLPKAPPQQMDPRNPNPGVQTQWQDFRLEMLKALKTKLSSGGGNHSPFYVHFDSAGYLSMTEHDAAKPLVLVLLQVGGGQVTEYMFYPLNPNTGTRLVF